MGRPKQSMSASQFESIERDIAAFPNGSVFRKLMILHSFSWLTTEEVSKAHRINPRTLFRWINRYNKYGVKGLIDRPKGHKPAILSDEMKSSIVEWVSTQKDSDGKPTHWTLDRLRGELERVYGVKISKSAMSVNLAKMKISFRRPRPTHVKGDKEKQADFKKNSRLPEG